MSTPKEDSGLLGIPGSLPPPEDKDEPPEDAFGAPVGPMPSVSSRINYGDIIIDEKNLVDLWVVGAGTLGTYAVKEWKKRNRKLGSVIAETNSMTRHAVLCDGGAEPCLRKDRDPDRITCARNVLGK